MDCVKIHPAVGEGVEGEAQAREVDEMNRSSRNFRVAKVGEKID